MSDVSERYINADKYRIRYDLSFSGSDWNSLKSLNILTDDLKNLCDSMRDDRGYSSVFQPSTCTITYHKAQCPTGTRIGIDSQLPNDCILNDNSEIPSLLIEEINGTTSTFNSENEY